VSIAIMLNHVNSIYLKKNWISMLSILHRAKIPGIISNSLYLQLRSEFNDRGGRRRQANHIQKKEHTFSRNDFSCSCRRIYGESSCELMNIPLESFRSLRAMESLDVAHYQWCKCLNWYCCAELQVQCLACHGYLQCRYFICWELVRGMGTCCNLDW